MIFLPLIIIALAFGIGIELLSPNAQTYLDIFEYIIGLLIGILDVLLSPINLLISSYLPELDNTLTSIAQYFSYASTYIGWLFNATGFPLYSFTLIATYYLFKFSITIVAYSFKTLIQWKNALL